MYIIIETLPGGKNQQRAWGTFSSEQTARMWASARHLSLFNVIALSHPDNYSNNNK